MLWVALLIGLMIVIVICRLLARAIRELNRYDAGMPPRKGRKL